MATELVQLSFKGSIATIVLNRAAKLNALNAEMLDALETYADELDRNQDVRVVLLAGTGKAFCVGADIYEWSDLSPLEMGRRWIRDGHRIFARIARLPQPVIAVLNGYTFGGGLELALAADLRLAAEGVQLSFPEVKLGIIPGWGGTQRLAQLIGPSRAKQMIFSGERVAAEQAETWGLVNEVTPADKLAERALELAETIAGQRPSCRPAHQATHRRRLPSQWRQRRGSGDPRRQPRLLYRRRAGRRRRLPPAPPTAVQRALN